MSITAKLEWLVTPIYVTDTMTKRELRWVKTNESLNCDRTRGISQCVQSILRWLIMVLITSGGQVEVIIQGDDILRRVPDAQYLSHFLELYGKTGSFSFFS